MHSQPRALLPTPVRILRRAERTSLVTRVPVLFIAGASAAAVAVAGVLMRLADPSEFHSVPAAMWWAVQTITTVGYGDLVLAKPWRVLTPIKGSTGALMWLIHGCIFRFREPVYHAVHAPAS